jgi:lipopolysaccharide/colanic/teichoic acid biosynthesis glycosyltransferase
MTARDRRGGLDWWRVFEVAACCVGLVVLAPVLALAAIAIWIDDRSPILFRQTRVGKDGIPFRLIKFRTMRTGVAGAKITSAGDRRVTWTGSILRRYKIDEIPQIWNVLRGDMSLVGPRPEVPEYVNYQDPRWRKILARRPGITDLSTLVHCREEETLSRFANPEQGYAEVILPEKLALSLEYESHRTFRSDALLLLLTIRYSLRPAGLDPNKICSQFLPRSSREIQTVQ